MDLSNFFPSPAPIVSTGLASGDGVTIGKELYSGSPNVANGLISDGQPVGIFKEGRIPVIGFIGGFHTP